MPRFALFVIVFGLTLYALVDCVQTPTPRHLSKGIWLVVITLLPVLGPILWLLYGRVTGGGWGRWDDSPSGPDDDPSFMRDLYKTR